MLYSSCTLISLNGFPSKTLKPSCDPQSSTSSEMSLALVAALRTCTADSLPDLVEGKQLPVPPGTPIDKWVESEFWRLLLCHPTRAILQDFLPLWAGTSNELCPTNGEHPRVSGVQACKVWRMYERIAVCVPLAFRLLFPLSSCL